MQCFKIGRLTLPPSLVLSYCGFGKPSNWSRTAALVKAGKQSSAAWLKGGWRDELGVLEEFGNGKRNGAKGEILRDTLTRFGR